VEQIKKFELSKEYLERLQSGIAAEDTSYILDSLTGVNVADIAAILDELETFESIYVLRLMEGQLAADIVIELYDTTLEKVLQEVEIKEVASWIQLMDSDDGADIISYFSEKEREEVIAEIDDRIKLEQILELLRYEEDTAGGIMAKEFIRANKNWNVVQTINEIRRQAENVEKIYSIYVVNNKQQLLGRVSLKKIILAASETKIEDIIDENVIAVPVYMDQEEVATLMRKYDLESVPVVNAKNKLVGRITVDDILDVVQEEAEEDIQAMAGVSADIEESDSVFTISKARLPWLLIGVIGG
jgi:magnesium transporter